MRVVATSLGRLPVDAPGDDRVRFIGPGVEEALGALHLRWVNLRARLLAKRKRKPPRDEAAASKKKSKS